MMKYRINENVWGNWYGYAGNHRVAEFGTDEHEANVWLRKQTKTDLIDRVFEYLLHQTQYASKTGDRESYDNYNTASDLIYRLM